MKHDATKYDKTDAGRQDTRGSLLAEAEALVRTRGFASFSYADLSDRVGIRKASIHHHFPTKEALGVALIDEYLERFKADLAAISQRKQSQRAKLLAYGDFFAASMRDGMMPLCGSLAAERAELPATMQERVVRFFDIHMTWLEGVIREGVANGEFSSDLPAKKVAAIILSVLEGASLVAWARKDFANVKPTFLLSLDAVLPA